MHLQGRGPKEAENAPVAKETPASASDSQHAEKKLTLEEERSKVAAVNEIVSNVTVTPIKGTQHIQWNWAQMTRFLPRKCFKHTWRLSLRRTAAQSRSRLKSEGLVA